MGDQCLAAPVETDSVRMAPAAHLQTCHPRQGMGYVVVLVSPAPMSCTVLSVMCRCCFKQPFVPYSIVYSSTFSCSFDQWSIHSLLPWLSILCRACMYAQSSPPLPHATRRAMLDPRAGRGLVNYIDLDAPADTGPRVDFREAVSYADL